MTIAGRDPRVDLALRATPDGVDAAAQGDLQRQLAAARAGVGQAYVARAIVRNTSTITVTGPNVYAPLTDPIFIPKDALLRWYVEIYGTFTNFAGAGQKLFVGAASFNEDGTFRESMDVLTVDTTVQPNGATGYYAAVPGKLANGTSVAGQAGNIVIPTEANRPLGFLGSWSSGVRRFSIELGLQAAGQVDLSDIRAFVEVAQIG